MNINLNKPKSYSKAEAEFIKKRFPRSKEYVLVRLNNLKNIDQYKTKWLNINYNVDFFTFNLLEIDRF